MIDRMWYAGYNDYVLEKFFQKKINGRNFPDLWED